MRDRLRPSELEQATDRPQKRPPAPPQLASIIALQRSAGNQAVSRVLARLTDYDLEQINADRKTKKRFQEAQKLWGGTFNNEQFHNAPSYEPWDHLVKTAKTLEALETDVDDRVKKAKEWKQKKDKTPERKPEPKVEKQAPEKPTPSSAPEKAPKKEKQWKTLDLESLETPNPWESGNVLEQVTATPVSTATQDTTPQAPDVSQWTSRIDAWKPKDDGHAGVSAKKMTISKAREVVRWLQSDYSRSGTVFVRRGEGSGDWSGKTQLKIIHRVEMDGSKHSTYHLTLSQRVYDQLTEVQYAGADKL